MSLKIARSFEKSLGVAPVLTYPRCTWCYTCDGSCVTLLLLHPVAYLGFPAPGGKLSFGAPTQRVHGSIDAKNELGIKGRRKLTQALLSPAYICF